jgi:hypothetical protein
MNIPLLDVLRQNRLAVHTWWHSWNHYGMFGLSSEHSTLLCAEREGYVPLDAKEMYLKAVVCPDSRWDYTTGKPNSDWVKEQQERYVAAVKAMFKKEKEWADAELASTDDHQV